MPLSLAGMIGTLGAQAGAAQGLAQAALSINDTIELRRRERAERMMHVERLLFGMEQIAAEERAQRLRARLQLTELAGIDARDIRGHDARQRLQRVQMVHEVSLQDSAQAAEWRLLQDRLRHEQRENALERALRAAEGEADRANRLAVARLQSGPDYIFARAAQDRERRESDQQIYDSIGMYLRNNFFTDSQGKFDPDSWRKISEQAGLHPD